MELYLSLAALIISILALSSSYISNIYERKNYIEQIYQRFAQMWYDMDQIFISYPEMRKYFYKNYTTDSYAELLPNDSNYELGLSIAEMFCDVFQYSKPLERYLSDDDRESYLGYKEMIMSAPIVQVSQSKNLWNKK